MSLDKYLPKADHYTRTGGLGIGLAGAHRTGKTTTAQMLSELNNFPVLTNVGSDLAAQMGIDMSKPMTLSQRLDYQEARLDVTEEAYQGVKGELFVADRTPLDLAAYLVAETPNALDQETIDRIEAYIQRCIDMANKYFGFFAFFRPTLPYVSAPGKPPANTAYQQLISILISGLLVDSRVRRNFIAIPLQMNNREDRVNMIADYANEYLDEVKSHFQSFPTC